jgi:hypothetical protein
MPLDVVKLVLCMHARRDREHLVELFKREPLGFREEEQDQDEEEGTPRGVPPERARVGEAVDEGGEREGDDEIEGPCGGGREGHAELSNVQWIDLGGVGEWD